MSGHAERESRGDPPRRWWQDFDRRWYWRIALAVAIVAALALVARVSMIAFGGGGKRVERFEQSVGREPSRGAAPGAGPPP